MPPPRQRQISADFTEPVRKTIEVARRAFQDLQIGFLDDVVGHAGVGENRTRQTAHPLGVAEKLIEIDMTVVGAHAGESMPWELERFMDAEFLGEKSSDDTRMVASPAIILVADFFSGLITLSCRPNRDSRRCALPLP